MAFPLGFRTTNMAGALPNIGYHISEKELIREKMGIFDLGACEVARSLQTKFAGLDGL